MDNQMISRSEYAIRFVCAFIVVGVINVYITFHFFDFSNTSSVAISIFATLGISIYTAKIGDRAWRELSNLCTWWY